MKTHHGILKRIAKLGLLLLLGASMSACGKSKGWKEEVQLHDGRVIVVERFFNLGGYRGIESQERAELDQTITFTLPDSNKSISWKTEYRNDIPEPNSLSPLLLDVVEGVPYLATSPAGCIAYNKWERPNPPYILFKYINDAWQRIPLQEFPPMLVHSNLFPGADSRLLKPYYTKEATKAEWAEGNRSGYGKTILREAVKNAGGVRCDELVYDNGTWRGKSRPKRIGE